MFDRVAWSFDPIRYNTVEEFVAAVEQYANDIDFTNEWNPTEVAVNSPEFSFIYEAWLEGPQDFFENEKPTDPAHTEFKPEHADDGLWQTEIVATLTAPNGASFTGGELLWLVHNQLSNKELGDHVFFEGLATTDDGPSYLNLGS